MTIEDVRDLGILRTLDLIELRGMGRGAYWIRKGDPEGRSVGDP